MILACINLAVWIAVALSDASPWRWLLVLGLTVAIAGVIFMAWSWAYARFEARRSDT